MAKKIIIGIVLVVIAFGLFKFFDKNSSTNLEQQVYSQTMALSKEYLSLRLQTNNVLVNAKNYLNYESWNTEMTEIIKDWENLEKESQELKNSTVKTANSVVINLNFIQRANAYSAKEISNIYDKAPRLKGIATLANHLGVDAKRAQVILDKAQAEISSGVFTEEGDTFETLEHTAIVVKDSCKVTGFVGGVVLTGGVAGLATAGTLTTTTVVVAGVDLALEVTEDGAQIAFGDKNKVSSFVKDVRTVTEPIANVLTITNIPGNLGNIFGKFDAVMVGLEQFRESAQEGKVIGVDLTSFEYQKPFERIRQAKYPKTVTAAEMEMAEVETWLQSLNKKQEPMTQKEVEDFLSSSTIKSNKKSESLKEDPADEKSSKKSDDSNDGSIVDSGWKGTLVSVSGGNEQKQSKDLDFILNKDGTVSGGTFKKWKQEGNSIRMFGEDEADGYYEFNLSGNSLTLSKMMIGGEAILPGQEYMGGIAPSGVLYKKTGSNNEENKETSKKGIISKNEWDAWGDAQSRYKKDLIEKFGTADITKTKSGKQMWVYHDLAYYDSETTCSPVYTFYDTDQVATRRCETTENVESIINHY